MLARTGRRDDQDGVVGRHASRHVRCQESGAVTGQGWRLATELSTETVGVEEEFLLVDSGTGRTSARTVAVLALLRDTCLTEFPAELAATQVEAATGPCTDLAELRAALTEMRSLRRARPGHRRRGAESPAAVAADGAAVPVPACHRGSPRPPTTTSASTAWSSVARWLTPR
jgi:hypothetical protein